MEKDGSIADATKLIKPVHEVMTLQQISIAVYELVVLVQQDQPDLLLEKYQKIAWKSDRYKSAFIEKLSAKLSQASNQKVLMHQVERWLMMLFVPGFFESLLFKVVISRIEQIIDIQAQLLAQQQERLNQPVLETVPSQRPEAIAILLQDAENIKLSVAEEQFLAKSCTCPIQIRIAFANWRYVGKLDIEFHERGYQMIHVPAGKNTADLQMTALGASVFLAYPTAQEVLVCSSDSDLLSLCNILQTHGLTVYSVRKKDDYMIMINRNTGVVKACIAGKGLSPKAALEQKLAIVLEELTAHSPGEFINIAALNSHFQKVHGRSVTDMMRELDLGTKYLKFLTSCRKFKLQDLEKGWHIAFANTQSSVETN
jgi:hypothetical protein